MPVNPLVIVGAGIGLAMLLKGRAKPTAATPEVSPKTPTGDRTTPLPPGTAPQTPISDRPLMTTPRPISTVYDLQGVRFTPFADPGTITEVYKVDPTDGIAYWRVVVASGKTRGLVQGQEGDILATDLIDELRQGVYRQIAGYGRR